MAWKGSAQSKNDSDPAQPTFGKLSTLNGTAPDDQPAPPSRPDHVAVPVDVGDISAHGLKPLLHYRSAPLRTFFAVFLLAAWFVCAIQIVQVTTKYFRFEVNVNVVFEQDENYEFPAVTICNLNPVRRDAMLQSEKIARLLERIVKNVDGNPSLANETGSEPGMPIRERVQRELRYQLYQQKVLISPISHKLEQMVVQCDFQGIPCGPKNFSHLPHAIYGSCYTMIVSGEQLPNFVGPRYGLSLVLYVDADQYLPHYSPSLGFRVHLHHPLYPPSPEDRGFSISPGFQTMAPVTKHKVRRLDLRPLGGAGCGGGNDLRHQRGADFWKKVTGGHVNYTYTGCVELCFLRQLRVRCGCVDAELTPYEYYERFFDDPNYLPACHYANDTQMDCRRKILKAMEQNRLCYLGECPQACYYTWYVPSVTQSLWPRAEYLTVKLPSWSLGRPELRNITVAQAYRQLAALDIYFQHVAHVTNEQVRAMDMWALLSQIGGTMGLYAGMSFLTFIEIVDVFIRKIRPCYAKCNDFGRL